MVWCVVGARFSYLTGCALPFVCWVWYLITHFRAGKSLHNGELFTSCLCAAKHIIMVVWWWDFLVTQDTERLQWSEVNGAWTLLRLSLKISRKQTFEQVSHPKKFSQKSSSIVIQPILSGSDFVSRIKSLWKYPTETQKKKYPPTMTPTDADDVRRGFLRRVENSFLGKILRRGFRLVFFRMEEESGEVWGWKNYFYYPNKRKEIFLYRNIHDLPTGCILSESLDAHQGARVRGKFVNEPSARMVMEFYCYILRLHTWWGWMEACLLCVLVNNLLNHVIPQTAETFATGSWR